MANASPLCASIRRPTTSTACNFDTASRRPRTSASTCSAVDARTVTDFLGPYEWFGTHGRSGKPTVPVTLFLEDGEDIVLVKLSFTNKKTVGSLCFTTSTGRVVDSGVARRQIGGRVTFPGGFPNVPDVLMQNNGAPVTGFIEMIYVRSETIAYHLDPVPCLVQSITFKFQSFYTNKRLVSQFQSLQLESYRGLSLLLSLREAPPG